MMEDDLMKLLPIVGGDPREPTEEALDALFSSTPNKVSKQGTFNEIWSDYEMSYAEEKD